MRRLVLPVLLLALVAGCATSAGPAPAWRGAAPLPAPGAAAFALADDDAAEEEQEDDGLTVAGFLWGVVWYVPNRVLDVLDVVRARIRLGPGFAFGARATEYADVFLGTYASVYVGLPGPRGRTLPRLPAGLESKSGAEVSVADVTLEGGMGPDYGMTECGVGLQAFLVGFDVGVDPLEILDLVVGIFTFDPMDDDF